MMTVNTRRVAPPRNMAALCGPLSRTSSEKIHGKNVADGNAGTREEEMAFKIMTLLFSCFYFLLQEIWLKENFHNA